jgi:FkbM family methyltransferase
MHLGEDTAYYLAKGYRVVAFEANPELVKWGRERFAEALEAGRLVIEAGAISDEGSTVTFYRHPTATEWGTTEPGWAERNEHSGRSLGVTVPVIDFADALRRHGVPAYLKVDIEGADKHALMTLAESDARPQFVSIESAKTSIEEIESELELLGSLGYRRFVAVQQARMHLQTIETTTLDGRLLSYRFERHSSGPFGDDVPGWTDRADLLARYRRILWGYRLFDNPFMNRPGVRYLRFAAAKILRRPIPGWFDTHARLD